MALRALLLLSLFAIGCGTEIGDDCKTSLDCSNSNNRICDRQQPGGYCTISGCESSSCPDDAVCVTFRPQPARLSSTWCMAACEEHTDCRKDEGYRCRTAAELNALVPNSAAVPYDPGARFCVVPPAVPPEMMMSMPDAGSDAGNHDAGAVDGG